MITVSLSHPPRVDTDPLLKGLRAFEATEIPVISNIAGLLAIGRARVDVHLDSLELRGQERELERQVRFDLRDTEITARWQRAAEKAQELKNRRG